MPRAALQRHDGAHLRGEIEESQAFVLVSDMLNASAATVLARAELEAAFAMFGTLEEAGYDEWADGSYRADAPRPLTPANDVARRKLHKRGLHVDPRLPIQLIAALDWVVVLAGAEFAARWATGAGLASINIGAALSFIAASGALKLGLWLTDAYQTTPAAIRAERGLGGLTLGAFIGLFVANILAPTTRDAGALSATLPFAAMLIAATHAAFAIWIRAAHKRGVFAETIAVVGATEAAARFVQRAEKTGEARIVAIADDRLANAPDARAEVVGGLDALLVWEGLPHADRIVIAIPPKAEARVAAVIARLRPLPNRIDLLLDYEAKGVQGPGADCIAGAPIARIAGRRRNFGRAVLKRVQDLILSAALLVLLALPMMVIALAVKLESKGPSLFRQQRHGFNNHIFTVLKFRTLREDHQGVTRVGAHLRRTGLDNLPQLFNVLSGDMSLVGPRPHDVSHKAGRRTLSDIAADYAHRHRVKPGLIGWAQLHGACGMPKTQACARKCVRLDLEYVARASFLFDMQILLAAALALFGRAKRS